MDKNTTKSNTIDSNKEITRPPVVVIMGHVDHGKSTLLDYIRKSKIVDSEAGGITQHISAYEVIKKDEKNQDRYITFLDTPGHEAFSKMRTRGAQIADIAILVVSAEDGVKAQTIEAFNTIIENKIPYIVAINKIDKPNANIERTKMDLSEKGIYLEGMGGDIPFVLISAKDGSGVDDLLDMIILVADLGELKGDPSQNASGIIVEANCEPRRGISASCIIKNGTLKSGMYIACGTTIVSTKILENFLGKTIKEATFSSPILLVGFDSIPEVGSTFQSFATKKEAEKYVNEIKNENLNTKNNIEDNAKSQKTIPIIIKTDVAGSIEAIEKEMNKLNTEDISFKIIGCGAGAINESDIRMGCVNKETIVIGFNTKLDNRARDLNESLKVEIKIFEIIYKLTDWLKELIEDRRPKQETVEVTGSVKILRIFGNTKDKKVIGGKVSIGKIILGSKVRIIRRDSEIGTGKIVDLQANKIKTKEVLENSECGMQIESKIDIAPGDVLEAFIVKIV
jgi:translation initiation factor IF-2